MRQSDADFSTKQQPLPPLSRDALHRIEQAEKNARERYYQDTKPHFPASSDFLFFEGDILRAKKRVLEYVRIFAEDVLDGHLGEYLEAAPADLLTNDTLLKSLAGTIYNLTDELWKGYNAVLFLEPGTRRARYSMARAAGTMDQHPELEPGRYPDQEQWAESCKRMTEQNSEMERLNARFEVTIARVTAKRIEIYQNKAASRLGVTLRAAGQPRTTPVGESVAGSSPAETRYTQPQTATVENGSDKFTPHRSQSSGTLSRATWDENTPIAAESRTDADDRQTEGQSEKRQAETALQSQPAAAVALSKRDTQVHDVVGAENFRKLTNREIMETRGLKTQLVPSGLKPGTDVTKACVDRIRRAKGYPLSREIINKRSTQK